MRPRNRLGSQRLPLTSLQAPTSPAGGSAPVKKDPNALEPTPLEKLLANAGPLRTDGSDKFFGFENVSAPMCLRDTMSPFHADHKPRTVWEHMVIPCPPARLPAARIHRVHQPLTLP